jgi:SAM-dependent methyltransferase
MMFDTKQLDLVRIHLLGDGSAELIQYMKTKSLSGDTSVFSQETIQTAQDLGWIADPGDRLTDLGICAADSCREYQFWQERDKTLPFEGAAPHLTLPFFNGRSVLEIGSGMGANLMSLSATASQVCGIEPVMAYIQLGEILCDREGIAPPDMRPGAAEDLPFGDDTADMVLCVSAHQYFDIRQAFPEISRVLKPSGELIIVGGTLKGFMKDGINDVMQRRGGAKSYAITIINTLSYMFAERRIITGRGKFSTTRPIYPSRASMMRWLSKQGLVEISPPTKIGWETCFHMRQGPK